MSKYVDKKHGLIIGSDNMFDIMRNDGKTHSYPAIVWAKRYVFDQINTVNVFVETPANQIIWTKEEEKDDENRDLYFVSEHVCDWLGHNVGEFMKDWDCEPSRECDRAIFFRRRTDALNFTKHIESLLEGIKYR